MTKNISETSEAYNTILETKKDPFKVETKFKIEYFFGDFWKNHYKEFLGIDFDKKIEILELKLQKHKLVLHQGEEKLGRFYYRNFFDPHFVVLAAKQSADKEEWDLTSILESKRPMQIYATNGKGRVSQIPKQFNDIIEFLEKGSKAELMYEDGKTLLHQVGDGVTALLRINNKDFPIVYNFKKLDKNKILNYNNRYDEIMDYVKNSRDINDTQKHQLLIFLNLSKRRYEHAVKNTKLFYKIKNIFSDTNIQLGDS